MLKKYMVLLNLDANTGGGSSPTPDAKGADSSTAAQDTNAGNAQEPTIASVAKEVFDKSSSQEGSEGDVPNKDKADGKVAEPENKEEQKQPEADPDKELPFHQHPRFQQVVKERKEYEAKVKEHEERLKTYEPSAKEWDNLVDFRRQYSIPDEDFINAMNILAAQRTDPARAREMLKPIWESMQAYDENALPPEIQKQIDSLKTQVEEGHLTEDTARMVENTLRENAKLRNQQKINGQRGKLTAEQQARAQQQAINTSLHSWDHSTRNTDPDFKPKADPNAPDGVYELTVAKLSHYMTMKPPTNQQEAVQMVEKAYKEVKQLFSSRLTPKGTQRPPLTSTSSSTKPSKPASTIREAVAEAAGRHGIDWH